MDRIKKPKVYDDEDDTPRRKKPSPSPLPIMVAVGALAVALGAVAVSAVLFGQVSQLRAELAQVKEQQQKPQTPTGFATVFELDNMRQEQARTSKTLQGIETNIGQRLTALEQRATRQPEPTDTPKPKPKEYVENRPKEFVPAALTPLKIQVGQEGEWLELGVNYTVRVRRVIDGRAAVLTAIAPRFSNSPRVSNAPRTEFDFLAVGFDTTGLADGKMLNRIRKWRVIGTHRLSGTTYYVLEPTDDQPDN